MNRGRDKMEKDKFYSGSDKKCMVSCARSKVVKKVSNKARRQAERKALRQYR